MKRQLKTIKPDFANAQFNKSINLLLNGNLKEGFGLYEYRWEKRDPVTKRKFDQPLWLGKENIEGKTILIHSEQGLGDSIQFSRYLELIRKYCAKVLFEVPKPVSTIGIGVDALPLWIIKNHILSGNDIGMLGNVEAIPFEIVYDGNDENENTLRLENAKELLNSKNVSEAWKVLIS